MQALLETGDSSDAYMLLQSMAPMTYDASRLLDTACKAFSHLHDSLLGALQDQYRPAVLQRHLARAQRSKASSPQTSSSPRSPLAKSRPTPPSPPGLPAQGDTARLVLRKAHALEEEKVPAHVAQMLQDCAPLIHRTLPADDGLENLGRRTRSAATLGSALMHSVHAHRHRPHRLNLHALAAFVPDFQQPGVQAALRIASKPTLQLGGSLLGALTLNPGQMAGTSAAGGEGEAVWPGNRHPDGGGATIDIGALAHSVKRMALQQTHAYRGAPFASHTAMGHGGAAGGNQTGDGWAAEPLLLRRITDGGALLMPSLAWRLTPHPGLRVPPATQQPMQTRSALEGAAEVTLHFVNRESRDIAADAQPPTPHRPRQALSPGTPQEKAAQTQRPAEELNTEVAAVHRRRAAEEKARETQNTALELREPQAATAALQQRAALQEAEAAKQDTVVQALMRAVSRVSSSRQTRSPRVSKSHQ